MGLTLLFFAFFFLYVTLDAFSKHSDYGFIALVTYLHPFQFLDQHMGNMVLLQRFVHHLSILKLRTDGRVNERLL